MKRIILILLLVTASAFAQKRSLQSIYTSLDPTSISQHFAFYELYPDTALGKEALRHAWNLLRGTIPPHLLPSIEIHSLISFVNRPPHEKSDSSLLSEKQLLLVEQLSSSLKNRKLKGFGLWDPVALEQLPLEEIDLSRALFLAELESDTPEIRQKIRSYEAQIDFMALQLLARLREGASAREQIRAINDLLFGEMRFRFPPHSLMAKEIDLYTLLPFVLDSRRGVCLGVSILYLCLAQRLGLPLEIITPPGHIYVRHVNAETNEVINIETTARGVNLPSETYLGIETRTLQQRTLREVIGLAFMNQAAVTWHRGNKELTVKLYEQASRFLSKDDYLLNLFLGFNYLFANRTEEGTALLRKIQGVIPDHQMMADPVSEDFLKGNVDLEGIQAIFQEVDEQRSSILEKQRNLEQIMARFPLFRSGYFHLAITHLQLGSEKKALPYLLRYVELQPSDPTAEYYLATLYFQRFHFNQAWKHLIRAEEILSLKDHHPRALKELRRELQKACPKPL